MTGNGLINFSNKFKSLWLMMNGILNYLKIKFRVKETSLIQDSNIIFK